MASSQSPTTTVKDELPVETWQDVPTGLYEESFRDSIGTLDEQGKRRWIYVKKIWGRFFMWRTLVAVVLIGLMLAGPFIEIGGHPLMLFDILNRKFVIFAQPFWPQDSHLLVLAMLTALVSIALFTVVYGRIFCGWVCPQTIFMEHVFRRIEYLIEGDAGHQRKLAKLKWTNPKRLSRMALKHAVFFGISFLIGNVFLLYLIGKGPWFELVTDNPLNHLGGLGGMLGFSFVFYFVFSRFREQVCIVACPYGRMQGILLDDKSVVVAYDYLRGEPREKLRRNQERQAGDCIDCGLCVHVCPTGIDIRNGTQLECINCTNCMDACDSVMDKIGKDRGLIRYASEQEIRTGEKQKLWTPRALAYTAVLALLLIVFGGLLFSRNDVETTLLRKYGTSYDKVGEQLYSNTYDYTLVNKTFDTLQVDLRLLEPSQGRIVVAGDQVAPAQQSVKNVLRVEMPEQALDNLNTPFVVGIYVEGEKIDEVEATFLGPMKAVQ